eukprot:1377089-Rhodomonas_salina.1
MQGSMCACAPALRALEPEECVLEQQHVCQHGACVRACVRVVEQRCVHVDQGSPPSLALQCAGPDLVGLEEACDIPVPTPIPKPKLQTLNPNPKPKTKTTKHSPKPRQLAMQRGVMDAMQQSEESGVRCLWREVC